MTVSVSGWVVVPPLQFAAEAQIIVVALLRGTQHPLAQSLPVRQLAAHAWIPPENATHVDPEQQLAGSGHE